MVILSQKNIYTGILKMNLRFTSIFQPVGVPLVILGIQEFQVDLVKNVSVIHTVRCLFPVILSLDSARADLDLLGGSVLAVNPGMLVKA